MDGSKFIVCNFSEVVPLIVDAGSYTEGEFTAEDMLDWYSFTTTVGATYRIQWDDSYQGSDTYTSDIYLKVYDEGMSEYDITNNDSGYTTVNTIVAVGTEVFIEAYPYNHAVDNIGTYGIQILSLTTDLGAPENFTATGTATGVDLEWTAPSVGSDTVAGYNIYRSGEEFGVYQLIGTSTGLTFEDTGGLPSLTMYYKVGAVADNGAVGVLSTSANAANTITVTDITADLGTCTR
jgi:hypothetical protein